MKLKTLVEIENETIEERLIDCGYDTKLTAESLGVSRKTIYNRLQSIGITVDDMEIGRRASEFDLQKIFR